MTYARRHLTLQFQLGKGSFGADGSETVNTAEAPGLRASATITQAGGIALPQLDLRVWGLSLSLMNKLSTLGKPIQSVRENTVTVIASSGDDPGDIVFAGTIKDAWADMQAVPDAVFVVSAFSGLFQQMQPVAPSSYPGTVDVAVVMQDLAGKMGYAFENTGVSVQLSNPYFPGTAIMQAQSAARAAHINMTIEKGVLAIWPMNSNRAGQVPLISKDTGMVGYPAHTENAIALTTLYMPSISFGGQVKVESELTPAVGTWTVFNLRHELEAEMPDGKWFTQIDCNMNGVPTPIAR